MPSKHVPVPYAPGVRDNTFNRFLAQWGWAYGWMPVMMIMLLSCVGTVVIGLVLT